MSTNAVAQRLADELSKYGAAELTYGLSLFSGERSKKADIRAALNGREFKVIMFDPSAEMAFPCSSAHFSLSMNDDQLSDGHIAYWNTDNRFTKMYRNDDDVFLVMDTFLPAECDDSFVLSTVAMWRMALNEIPKSKRMYERMKDLF